MEEAAEVMRARIVVEASWIRLAREINDGYCFMADWNEGRTSALALVFPDDLYIVGKAAEAKFLNGAYRRRHAKSA